MFGRKSKAKDHERAGASADLLVVGLGNPGDKYDGTRHNVGAEAVELMAAERSERLSPTKEAALVAELRIDELRVVVAFPQTFMNDSGRSVRQLAKRHGVTDWSKLLIIHDELDLEPGVAKLKRGGGLAGHNGLKSITQHLHTQDYLRLRIGIGRPSGRQSVSDHVLRRPGKADRELLDIEIAHAAEMAARVATEDFDALMNEFNRRPPT